jgi:hypothetical protein
MRSLFGDGSLIEDYEFLGVTHGRQAMRDHQCRATGHQALQRLMYQTLVF